MTAPVIVTGFWLGQILGQVPDPTNALPAWLTGGGLAAILVFLLFRSEKRNDILTAALAAAQEKHAKETSDLHVDYRRLLDAAEERYRLMVEKYGEKSYAAIDALGAATRLVQSIGSGGAGDQHGRRI